MMRTRYPARRGPRGGRDRDLVREPQPEEPRPGSPIGGVVLTFYGRQYVMDFKVPGDSGQRRSRSDHLAVEVDRQWLRMSLREALLQLYRMVPRVMNRKERNLL